MIAIIAAAGIACGPAAPSPLAGSAPASPAAWPNEPPGMTLLTDWSMDQEIPGRGDVPIPGGSGWRVVYEIIAGRERGWAERTSDPDAPVSAPNVYAFVFPEGMVEGYAPATVYYEFTAREAYVAFWWKPSSPFDLGPNGNKVAFLFNGGGIGAGQQVLILLPDGRLHVLPEYPGDFRWRRPNVSATAVALGDWHRVEWYSNVATGTMKWWLDDVLQGSHTDVTNRLPFDMFQFSPTWGGNTGARKRQTDRYWFDHVRLSVR